MIHAHGLRYRYPGSETDAFSDLDFNVPKGTFAVLEAPGGAGKSTLMRLLMARARATSGALTVAGYDLAWLRGNAIVHYRRSLGILSDEVELIAERTVLENIALPLELSTSAIRRRGGREGLKERLLRTIHRFALDSVQHKRPEALSEGERRRAMIARAIVHEPLLLIADDPARALDPATAAAVWDLLFREHQRGMTIFATATTLQSDPRFAHCMKLGL